MTFISNSRKFIFVHPHKCAGTSIEIALSKTLQWNDIILGSTDHGQQLETVYNKQFKLSKHSRAADIKDVVGDEIWNSYFTFSIVRHPLDRMVSFYMYLKKMKGKDDFIRDLKLKTKVSIYRHKQYSFLAKHPVIQKQGIHQWPGIMALLESQNFSEFLTAIVKTNEVAAKTQFDFLRDKEQPKLAVDYICKVETLETDWQYICDKLNISNNLPHANQSRRTHQTWRDYYTQADIDFMVKQYQVDLEAFDYSV